MLDFDGTVSQTDVLDELILRFAVNDSWKKLEREWQNGVIGSYECLTKEFDLLRVQPDQLEAFLDQVPLDPGVGRLLKLLSAFEVPVAVLSDGVDLFINRLLGRLGVGPVAVRANTIAQHGDRIRLLCPNSSPICEVAAAHCKCKSAMMLHQPGRLTIYIGDGRSDLCPARKAGLVFAKSTLAVSLAREAIPYLSFDTLHDVADTLSLMWAEEPVKEESTSCRRGES